MKEESKRAIELVEKSQWMLKILYVGIRKCEEHHWINHWHMIWRYYYSIVMRLSLLFCQVVCSSYHILLFGMGVCT